MPAAANYSNFSQILKDVWHDTLEATYYEESPLLAMVPKDTGWSGNAYDVVINYGPVTGRSTKFETALANRGPSKVTRFVTTTNDNYVIWSVDHKLIQLSRNDAGAVERVLTGELERATMKFKRSMCWMLYGDGGGAVARIHASTAPSGTTVTVADKRKLRNIEPGDRLKAYSNSGAIYASAGTERSGGAVEVSSVSYSSGTITLVSSAPASWAVSDYLVPEDDYRNVFYGLDSYLPNVTDASVGTIWTCDRTVHRTRLAGVRIGGKGLQVEDAVKKALARGGDQGAKPSHIFMHTDDYYAFEMANQTKKFGSALNEKVGTIGFSGLVFTKPGGGEVRVYPDADCPKGIIYLLKLDDLLFRTAGDFPGFLTLDGKKFDMEPTANAFQGRMGGYGQFVVHNPGQHIVLDLTLSDP
jgi:hypothetical protein